MTSFLVLAGAWILVGIPAIVAIVRERRSPDLHFARAMDALGHQTPAASAPAPLRRPMSLTKRRAQVTSAIYLSAVLLLTIGLVRSSSSVLAGSVVLANLGTVYRISILRMQAIAAQRHAPPTVVLPPAPPEPPMVAILGPVTHEVALPAPDEVVDEERVVLIG